jgi:hypothetical protein
MKLTRAFLALVLALSSIATPAVAKCSGVSHFIETVRRTPGALVLHVKIVEFSRIQHGTAARRLCMGVAMAEVLGTFRGDIGKTRIAVAGGLNGDDMPNIGPLIPGSEWVLVVRVSQPVDLWLDLCADNALKVKGRTVEFGSQILTFAQLRERLNAN